MIQAILHSIITFIDILALSTLVGVALCLFWTAQPKNGEELPSPLAGSLRLLLMLCLAALIISSITNFIQRTMEMSGLGITSIMPVLPTVLFKTHYGRIGLVRSSGLGLALLISFVGKRRLNSRLVAFLILCASAAIAFSRSATSHAADFGDLSLQELSDWFHLVASSFWGGALMAIAGAFRPSVVAGDNRIQRIVAGFSGKFYALFGPVLSVLVMTGLYNAWAEVGSFGLLATTPYGIALSAKIALLLLLAFRYIAPPGRGKDDSAFAMIFLRRTRLDAIIMAGVFLSAAMLTHSIPARHSSHLEHAQSNGGHAGHKNNRGGQYAAAESSPLLHVETTPKDITTGTPVDITVRIEDKNGRPVEGLMVHHESILHAIIIGEDLKVFAHIHPEDLGPVTDEMLKKATFPLHFTFSKAGEYLLGLDFATADGLQSKMSYIKVAGHPVMGKPEADLTSDKYFGKYHVTLKTTPPDIKAGAETTLRFLIRKNKKPVKDLSHYLGAPMHIAVVLSDLKQFIHAHGTIPGEPDTHMEHEHMHTKPGERFGPEIEAIVVFPVKGVYKIFSQVNHHGKVLLFDFMVDVR